LRVEFASPRGFIDMGGELYGPSGSQDSLNILIINSIINTGRVIMWSRIEESTIKLIFTKLSTLTSRY